jgi:hypothetical protein
LSQQKGGARGEMGLEEFAGETVRLDAVDPLGKGLFELGAMPIAASVAALHVWPQVPQGHQQR